MHLPTRTGSKPSVLLFWLPLLPFASTFWLPWIAQAICVIVALMWLVPDRRIEHALHDRMR